MLYTSYLSKLNKLPEDFIKLIITRFPPNWFNPKDYKNTYLVKELAPSEETLLNYKKDNNWDKYTVSFYKQLDSDNVMQKCMDKIFREVSAGKDYCLVCFEKDYIHCHRYLLAQKLVDRGLEWKEF